MQKHLDLNKYRVFVFGSRVTGKSSERSDIDIGIDGATAVSAVIMESIKFEFCFDLSWKLVKTFLEEVKGVQCQSPKDCWRQAYTTGIITYDGFWMKLTDARNPNKTHI